MENTSPQNASAKAETQTPPAEPNNNNNKPTLSDKIVGPTLTVALTEYFDHLKSHPIGDRYAAALLKKIQDGQLFLEIFAPHSAGETPKSLFANFDEAEEFLIAKTREAMRVANPPDLKDRYKKINEDFLMFRLARAGIAPLPTKRAVYQILERCPIGDQVKLLQHAMKLAAAAAKEQPTRKLMIAAAKELGIDLDLPEAEARPSRIEELQALFLGFCKAVEATLAPELHQAWTDFKARLLDGVEAIDGAAPAAPLQPQRAPQVAPEPQTPQSPPPPAAEPTAKEGASEAPTESDTTPAPKPAPVPAPGAPDVLPPLIPVQIHLKEAERMIEVKFASGADYQNAFVKHKKSLRDVDKGDAEEPATGGFEFDSAGSKKWGKKIPPGADLTRQFAAEKKALERVGLKVHSSVT